MKSSSSHEESRGGDDALPGTFGELDSLVANIGRVQVREESTVGADVDEIGDTEAFRVVAVDEGTPQLYDTDDNKSHSSQASTTSASNSITNENSTPPALIPSLMDTPLMDAKARRKAEKKRKKAERRAQREGRGDPMAGRKQCTLCDKSVDLLIRCTYDESGEWGMVCGKCWNGVSGGVVDGDDAHPHYRYGGLWKNRRAQS